MQEEAKKFIAVATALFQQEWRFAKTMPKNPHEYALREKWQGEEPFEDVVAYLREHGTRVKFGGSYYLYFRLNEHNYWTMGAPLDDTILINRAYAKAEPHIYDSIAEQYVSLFEDEESKEEERELFAKLNIHGRVLDVGCGQGLFLDYHKPYPEEYLGIDPSQGMLAKLQQKHPKYRTRVQCVKFENFYREKFDTVVSLFGVPSYIDPSTWGRFREMLAPGGVAYLMFFARGYQPVTHERTNVHPDFYLTGKDQGELFRNFQLVTVRA